MKKRKQIVLFIFIMLLIIFVLIGSYFVYQNIKEQEATDKLITEIRNSYASFVIANKDKDIYIKNNKEYKKIGSISKETTVPLVKKEVTDKMDIYYQIAGTDYYIDYKNIKENNNHQEDKSLDNYLVTKTIKTTKTNLYQDNELKIEIDNGLEFDVLLTNDKKYYVKFLNDVYYIQDSYELIDKQIDVKPLKDISVLNFSNDITTTKLEEVLKYLSTNNYKTINIDDFKLWIYGNVNLEEKKILLLSYKELSSDKQTIVDKYNFKVCTDLEGITFVSGDTKLKAGDTKYYKYEVESSTTINRIKDMLNGVKEVKVNTSTSSSGTKVAVLNYHFFYDSSIREECNESICIDVSNFRKQLDYLKNNGYKTLTMQEFNDWMDKKITLPQKSVLITIDDGALGTGTINGNKLIPILEEYKMHATLFLITGWWDVNNYRSDYLEIHSHGDELHHNNYCRNGKCSYKGLMLTKEELKTDLQISVNKIGTNLAFCYPFYQKNNTMIEALKETGFKVAFVGGNRKARQSDNKYAVPRYVIYKNTSLNSFINMVK